MPIKTCFVTAELAPIAKVGGLADVSAALPAALHQAGHDVRVFLPFYRDLKISRDDVELIAELGEVPMEFGSHELTFHGYRAPFPLRDSARPGPMLILIGCDSLYDRPGIYSQDQDEFWRFLLLSRAAIETCQRLQWAPDIMHCNDWQTAMIPLLLKTLYGWDSLLADTRTLLTIHNIGHQGVFPEEILPFLNLTDGNLLHQDDLRSGRINYLKTGLLYADALNAVSPTYSREIQTAEYGMGLESILASRRDDLFGILNGIDTLEWDPQNDPLIPAPYSVTDMSGKTENKEALLTEMQVDVDVTAPTIGIVSRLTSQKGFELLFDGLPGLLAQRNVRLVVVGSGGDTYVQFFTRLRERFPDKVGFFHGFSNELAHLVEAGSDLFLMPSLYEPCGLNQMYSQRYGTLPIVRRTGGLADTVKSYNGQAGKATGFVFDHFTSDGVMWAIGSALDLYEQSQQGQTDPWRQLVRNAMSTDFSWDAQSKKYALLYDALLQPKAAPRK